MCTAISLEINLCGKHAYVSFGWNMLGVRCVRQTVSKDGYSTDVLLIITILGGIMVGWQIILCVYFSF